MNILVNANKGKDTGKGYLSMDQNPNMINTGENGNKTKDMGEEY